MFLDVLFGGRVGGKRAVGKGTRKKFLWPRAAKDQCIRFVKYIVLLFKKGEDLYEEVYSISGKDVALTKARRCLNWTGSLSFHPSGS